MGPLVICISHHYYFVTSFLLFSVCNKLPDPKRISVVVVFSLFFKHTVVHLSYTLNYDVIFLFFLSV